MHDPELRPDGPIAAVAVGESTGGGRPSGLRNISPEAGRAIRIGIFAAVVAFLVVAPGIVGPYTTTILTTMLIYGILTMSLDLLVGYTGLASFGHAAFFGTGAYVGALVSLHVSTSLWATLGLATLGAGLMAVLIGALTVRAHGIYFVMVTLAIAQLLFSFASSGAGQIIGGSDGLPGVSRPDIAPLPFSIDFWNDVNFYYLVLLVAAIAYIALRGVVRSPFGATLEGIRENERRMRAIGYVTWRAKLAAFVIAGAIGGTAGALFAMQRGYTSPESLSFHVSGFALIMLLIGGQRTLLGGFVGAAFYVYLQDSVSSSLERWPLLFGLAFIVVMFLMRNGVVGTARNLLGGART